MLKELKANTKFDLEKNVLQTKTLLLNKTKRIWFFWGRGELALRSNGKYQKAIFQNTLMNKGELSKMWKVK